MPYTRRQRRHTEANIIEPLIELLNAMINFDSYTLEQIKENQLRG